MQSFILRLAAGLVPLRRPRINNLLTVGVGALALGFLLATGGTWLGPRPAVAMVCWICSPSGCLMGRMGAGDVKLMTALGLATDGIFVLTFIGAGIASVLWLLLAPRVWLHMSQGLRDRLRYLGPGSCCHLRRLCCSARGWLSIGSTSRRVPLSSMYIVGKYVYFQRSWLYSQGQSVPEWSALA